VTPTTGDGRICTSMPRSVASRPTT
jgi:hypothetical protein